MASKIVMYKFRISLDKNLLSNTEIVKIPKNFVAALNLMNDSKLHIKLNVV